MPRITKLTQKQRSDATKRQDRLDAKAAKERANGWCELRLEGCYHYAQEMHHIRPRSTHPHLRHDQRNHIAVCRRCHQWCEQNKRAGIELCDSIRSR